MTNYKSLEEYEFSELQEIPQGTLKTPTITEKEVMELQQLLQEDVILQEYIGEFNNKHFYFYINKSRYNEIKPYLSYDVCDERVDGIVLRISGTEYKFNPLFKDKVVLEMLETTYDEQEKIRKEVEDKTEIKNWRAISFYKSTLYPIISKSKDIEEFKKGFKECYEKAKADYIEEVMGDKISAEDLEKEINRRAEEKKRIYEDGEMIEWKSYGKDGFVKGNIIREGLYSYVLDSPVNKVLPFGFWEEICYGYGDLPFMVYYLNSRKISYELRHKIDSESETETREYKVVFNKDKIEVDGEEIPKGRLIFFLKRANGTKEKIKQLKKLNGRATQILEKTFITIYHNGKTIYLPFKAETTDGKTFHINIISRDFDISYDGLIPLFFSGSEINSSSPSIEKLFRFVDRLGVSKADLIEHIRRIKILGELNENN
jgi:hypothetical protein